MIGKRYTEEQITDSLRQAEGHAIVDHRQSLLLEARFSSVGRDVVASLNLAIEQAGTPTSITIDHGTEFTSKAREGWACRRGVKLDFNPL